MRKDGSQIHDEDSDLNEESRSSLGRKRTKSIAMTKSDMWIFVVNENGAETLFEQTDFDTIKPLGAGVQGKVYAAKVIFENERGELEVRYCVLKTIPKKSHAPIPFSIHEKISENDQTSVENNIIKLIKVVKNGAPS